MPHQVFNIDEVAAYLHIHRADIERLVKDHQIPFEMRGDRVVFRKREVDAWASQRILGLEDRHLTEYHQHSTRKTGEFLPNAAMMPEMMQASYIDPAMSAKTRASAIRDLVELADQTGLILDRKELLSSLEAREQLCSTALPEGYALLHPRHHQPYMFESSFIVLGRPVQDIHFGSPDGRPTELFFLICCQDDRLHLHTLARVCLMAQKTEMLTQLRRAKDAEEMFNCIIACEQLVLAGKKA